MNGSLIYLFFFFGSASLTSSFLNVYNDKIGAVYIFYIHLFRFFFYLFFYLIKGIITDGAECQTMNFLFVRRPLISANSSIRFNKE